jgi:hypothetical protein
MTIEQIFDELIENVPNQLSGDDILTTENWASVCRSIDLLDNLLFQSASPPLGFIYVQLHDQSEPSIFWPLAEWQVIPPEQYNGAFFRAEGGLAQPFDGQTMPQSDDIKKHSHKYWRISNGSSRGDKDGKPRWADNGDGEYWTSEVGGLETRPINYTIRLWKCIAYKNI